MGQGGRGCVNEGHILFLLDKQTRSSPMARRLYFIETNIIPNRSLDRNKEPFPPMDSSYQSLSAFLPASCFQTCLDIAHYVFDTSENNLLERKTNMNQNLMTDFG